MPVALHALEHVSTFYDDHYDTVMLVPSAAARLSSCDVQIDPRYHVDSSWFRAEDVERFFIWPNQVKCVNELEERLRSEAGFSKFRRLMIEE